MMIAPALLAAILAAAPAPDAASEPTLLDFTATWCGPCRQMRPAIEALTSRGYRIRPIDIDESPALAKRYHVESVPTFIVVDPRGREIARTAGYQPAAQLADFYREARAKLASADEPSPAEDGRAPISDEVAEERPAREETQSDSSPANPKPWQTVVRIRVHGNGTIGFGSGTIIHSTADEAIILTCAHIFHLDGAKQAHPSKFPLPVSVDLFDGRLRDHKPGQPGQVLASNESHRGQVIDYNFNTDVGLVRIKTGRRLPSSPVVPAEWQARPNLKMYAVGCAQGNDATAWSTKIIRSNAVTLRDKPSYEAIECETAPIQGRSGGGLYTQDGYLAGVCDFASMGDNRGLYPTRRSIHALLDRNGMTALYDGTAAASRMQLASREARPKAPAARPQTIARAQSPDGEEGRDVTIPDPEILGISDPTGKPVGRKSSSVAGRQPTWLGEDAARQGRTVRAKMERPALAADEFARDEVGEEPSAVAEATRSPGTVTVKGQWKAKR